MTLKLGRDAQRVSLCIRVAAATEQFGSECASNSRRSRKPKTPTRRNWAAPPDRRVGGATGGAKGNRCGVGWFGAEPTFWLSSNTELKRQVKSEPKSIKPGTEVGRGGGGDHMHRCSLGGHTRSDPTEFGRVAGIRIGSTGSVAAGDVFDLGFTGRNPRHHRAQLGTNLLD